MDRMNWLNLGWDGSVPDQTLCRCNRVIGTMIENSTAYRCYCQRGAQENLREKQMANGRATAITTVAAGDRSYIPRMSRMWCVSVTHGKSSVNTLMTKSAGRLEFAQPGTGLTIVATVLMVPDHYNFCVVVDDWGCKSPVIPWW